MKKLSLNKVDLIKILENCWYLPLSHKSVSLKGARWFHIYIYILFQRKSNFFQLMFYIGFQPNQFSSHPKIYSLSSTNKRKFLESVCKLSYFWPPYQITFVFEYESRRVFLLFFKFASESWKWEFTNSVLRFVL